MKHSDWDTLPVEVAYRFKKMYDEIKLMSKVMLTHKQTSWSSKPEKLATLLSGPSEKKYAIQENLFEGSDSEDLIV